jgi:hypothetical protein
VGEGGPLGELVDTLRTLPEDGEGIEALSAELRSLRNALPPEARQDEKDWQIDPTNPKTIRRILEGVEELLLARLLSPS